MNLTHKQFYYQIAHKLDKILKEHSNNMSYAVGNRINNVRAFAKERAEREKE